MPMPRWPAREACIAELSAPGPAVLAVPCRERRHGEFVAGRRQARWGSPRHRVSGVVEMPPGDFRADFESSWTCDEEIVARARRRSGVIRCRPRPAGDRGRSATKLVHLCQDDDHDAARLPAILDGLRSLPSMARPCRADGAALAIIGLAALPSDGRRRTADRFL